jgi:hypothetical protein
MSYIRIMDEYESNESYEQLAQNPNHKSGAYSHQSLGLSFIPHSVQGKTNVQGKPSTRVQGKNRITGVVFRVKPGSKPTSIQRVAPVGQGTGQPIGPEDFYQDSEVGSEMTHWRFIERNADGM